MWGRLNRAHPVLIMCILTALLCGVGAVIWDRVDPGPQRITLDFPNEGASG